MITTGIIKKINVSGGKHKNNKVIAEVSLFKSPGDINSDVYSCECNCSVPGGIYSPYNVGDKVYIGFLNGKKTNPIILGKIYQGLEDESRAFAYFSALKVRDQVNLPENTLLGDLKVADIKNLDKKIDNLNVIANRLPNPPIVDGEYNLRCSISGNEGTTINSKFISSTPDVKKSIRQSIQTKYGNTVIKNQIIKNGNFADTSEDWYNSGVSKAIANNTLTFTINQDVGGVSIYVVNDYTPTPGHKFLMSYKAKVSRVGIDLGYGIGGTYKTSPFIPTDTNWHVYCQIDTFTSNDVYKYIYIGNCLTGDEIQFRDYQVIDLAQWFGSNDLIPADLLAHPEKWNDYYSGDLSYNTGTLINATGRYLECGQSRNIWDEETQVGVYVNGVYHSEYITFLCSKNKIKVLPNTEYFTKCPSTIQISCMDGNDNFISTLYSNNNTFTTPTNCDYILFHYETNGQRYKNDICISLYYTPEQGGEGYDEYYPYIAPKVIDTGSEILRSAGSIYDYKTPDGTITRKVGRVDLGMLDWDYNLDYNIAEAVISDMKQPGSYDDRQKGIICSKYSVSSNVSLDNNMDDKSILRNVGKIYIRDTSYTDAATFKSAMSGVYLYYELATPTIEQGTSFQEDITINDYSYMLWKDASNNLANIPQGCDIFYLQKEGGEIRYYWALVN